MKNKIIGVIALLGVGALGVYSFSGGSGNITEKTEVVLKDGRGKELFLEKCTKCHKAKRPESKTERKAMLAPPIMGVMFHVNDGVKADNAKEKREKVIDFIVDYAHNPSKDKTFCEAHAIERFGIMPSQKNNVTIDELKEIANYLYDNYPSEGMKHEDMQKKMHGEEKGKNKSCNKH